MESDLGGTGTYTVNLSQTASSTTLTALPTATNQITATTSAAGAAQRTLTYRPGGDLAQDIHAGGIAYGYSYNAAKRLVGVTQNGSAAGAYAYDFMSRRVWRETYGSGAAQTAYIYDPQGHLLAEHNASTGAVSREYVWIDDMPVALLDISGSTVTTDFIHTGQIDEPLAVTNASQALVWNAYIDPYGTANFIGTPTETLDMRLPGQSFQLETNSLSQNMWRDYDPSLGRYIEADPFGIGGGLNIYAYVNADPLNKSDPLGLCVLQIAANDNQDICVVATLICKENIIRTTKLLNISRRLALCDAGQVSCVRDRNASRSNGPLDLGLGYTYWPDGTYIVWLNGDPIKTSFKY